MQLIGIESQGFLIDPDQVKICLRILGLLGGGVSMLIYYVAINNISDEFYEAAKVDGATRWRMMFSLTLPNMKNIIGIQLLLSLSSSLLAFDDIFCIDAGRPGRVHPRQSSWGIYNSIYYNSGYGIGMAMSVIVPGDNGGARIAATVVQQEGRRGMMWRRKRILPMAGIKSRSRNPILYSEVLRISFRYVG